MVEARTVAVRCACHMRRSWRGSGVYGRSGDGRAVAVHSRRLAMPSARGAGAASLGSRVPPTGGGEAFNMRMRNPHGRILTAVVVEGEGKGDQGGTLCERENALRPAIPAMLVASVRRPQLSGNEDQISRARPRRRRELKARTLRGRGQKGSGNVDIRARRRARGGRHCSRCGRRRRRR
eukprot:3969989-Pleurochrysis_carterae.AAC.1